MSFDSDGEIHALGPVITNPSFMLGNVGGFEPGSSVFGDCANRDTSEKEEDYFFPAGNEILSNGNRSQRTRQRFLPSSPFNEGHADMIAESGATQGLASCCGRNFDGRIDDVLFQ